MRTDHILKADLLDIVFENRNKNYGAYALRKHYNERLYKALGIMLFFMLLLSVFSFLHPGKAGDKRPWFDTKMGSILPTIPETPTKPKQREKPKQPNAPKILNTQQYTTIKITKDNIVDKLAKNLDSLVIDSKTSVGIFIGGKPFVRSPDSNTVVSGIIAKAIDKNIALTHPDVMPSYLGGMDALTRFLERNLNNPRELEDGEMISVKIKFIVGYDGLLKGFETIQDGGAAFNNEVIRVLKKMPRWIPGKTQGENVSVYYTIPVKFVSGNN